VAKVEPTISPEEAEAARARLSQNVSRLTPHQLMEVLTIIQQASSMPTVHAPHIINIYYYIILLNYYYYYYLLNK
jgi:hypothetical protein